MINTLALLEVQRSPAPYSRENQLRDTLRISTRRRRLRARSPSFPSERPRAGEQKPKHRCVESQAWRAAGGVSRLRHVSRLCAHSKTRGSRREDGHAPAPATDAWDSDYEVQSSEDDSAEDDVQDSDSDEAMAPAAFRTPRRAPAPRAAPARAAEEAPRPRRRVERLERR